MPFFLLKTRLFRLDPTFFGYNGIKQALLETLAPNYEIIPAKSFFLWSHKVNATGYYDIEKPLPDIISKLRLFSGLLNAACWLLSATGSKNG